MSALLDVMEFCEKHPEIRGHKELGMLLNRAMADKERMVIAIIDAHIIIDELLSEIFMLDVDESDVELMERIERAKAFLHSRDITK